MLTSRIPEISSARHRWTVMVVSGGADASSDMCASTDMTAARHWLAVGSLPPKMLLEGSSPTALRLETPTRHEAPGSSKALPWQYSRW